MGHDLETLQQLNQGYLRSAQTSDVRWYEEHLSSDFMPDGAAAAGRYTDVWSRRDGRWLCVAAHFTRF